MSMISPYYFKVQKRFGIMEHQKKSKTKNNGEFDFIHSLDDKELNLIRCLANRTLKKIAEGKDLIYIETKAMLLNKAIDDYLESRLLSFI